VIQHGDQPAAGIASIEQQQVVQGKPVEMFEQELTFAVFVDAVKGGDEH
jgi:hypothetical protein